MTFVEAFSKIARAMPPPPPIGHVAKELSKRTGLGDKSAKMMVDSRTKIKGNYGDAVSSLFKDFSKKR
jgi:hypothetical protein